MPEPRIIVALDYETEQAALDFVSRVTPSECALKVGFELFTAAGPRLVEKLAARDFRVFLDLKFHDIPTAVARACEAASGLGVWMLNVHASGGAAMLRAAAAALSRLPSRPLLIAVTVLTSMDADELQGVGVALPPPEQVLRLAGLARDSGLDGVVASAREVRLIRERLGENFLCVTPGIRPGGAAADDQRRTMTPREALLAGSSYLVIGRPVTRAPDPAAALESLNRSLTPLPKP